MVEIIDNRTEFYPKLEKQAQVREEKEQPKTKILDLKEKIENGQEITDELALQKVKVMAKQITSNAMLRHIIMQTQSDMRKQVYDQLKSFMAFTPQPFNKLIKKINRKEKKN